MYARARARTEVLRAMRSGDHRLARDQLARVAVDDALLDGGLLLRPDGDDPVHDDVLVPLAEASDAADGLC